MTPSSVYSLDIEKGVMVQDAGTDPTSNHYNGASNGTLSYDIHLVSVKYLFVSGAGVTVLNSLKSKDTTQQSILTA
jgi:hypothetical protein